MDPGRGAGGQELRRHNLAVLLSLITSHAPESRAGLAARTGLTKATVSALTAELIGAGLVHETGRRTTDRPGRPATWLAPDPLGPVGLGLVLGEGSIDGHLVDLADSPVARETRKLAHGAEHALRLCRPVLRKLLDTATSAGRYVAGVTLAADPSLAPQGLVAPLRQELAALGAHGIEVAAGEAVGFAAAAEPREPGEQRLLYLGGESELGARLSPGLGAEPRPGHPGTAHAGTAHAGTAHAGTAQAGTADAERYPFAHLPVRSRGLRCHCGARGCLECYTSRATIRADPETATEALAAALRPALAVLRTHVVVLGGRVRDLPAAELGAQLGGPVRSARLGAEASGRGAAACSLGHVKNDPATWLAQ